MTDKPITVRTRPGLGGAPEERPSGAGEEAPESRIVGDSSRGARTSGGTVRGLGDIERTHGKAAREDIERALEAMRSAQSAPGIPGQTLPLGSRLPPELGRLSADVLNGAPSSDTFPVATPRIVPPRVEVRGDAPLAGISGSRAQENAPPNPPAPLPFRANALRAKTEEVAPESLPQITDGRWALLGFISSAIMIALAGAYFGRVEVTSIAPGAMVVAGGPRPVLSQVSGVIVDLAVVGGDAVTAGQTIARIDATELEARKQRSAEQVARVREENQRVDADNTLLLDGTLAALQRKRALLVQRVNLKTNAQAERQEQAGRLGMLAKEGAISQSEALTARELESTSREESLVIRQQIADIDLELNDRQKAFADQKLARTQALNEAEAALREASLLLDLATVRAPVSGRVESLLVTRGQVVQPGAAFARIIPEGALTSVVVFAPVRDAAFLSPGLHADVEFASLPVSEFGKAPARVSRVSQDVASSDEVATVLGAAATEAVIRVELELEPSPTLEQVKSRLRSGERVTARLNTRKRRVITLVFDFLRKWYPS
jgi:multidrug resistance efflux pump